MNNTVSTKGEALFRGIVRSHVDDALVIFERPAGSERVRALVITPTRSTVIWMHESDLVELQTASGERQARLTAEVKTAFGIK